MSIAAEVTLRLQALARGDNVSEVTNEELLMALRERIGARVNAVKTPAVRKPRATKAKPVVDPDEIDLLAEDL